MDDLRAPEDLQRLWWSRGQANEEVETIMTQVLGEARRFRVFRRRLDIALIAVYALLLPLSLLCILSELYHFGEPVAAAGYGVWSVTLFAGLAAYAHFYRSFRDEPSPEGNNRRYIEQFIDYLGRRERFVTKSAIPASILLAVAGIVFAVGAYRGEDALFQVILSFVGQPWILWDTLRFKRNYERRRSRLQGILADLDATE